MKGSTLAQRLELTAVTLASLVLLQLVWGVARLLWLSPPEPVLPASSALQVEPLALPTLPARFEGNELVMRPLFWEGRERFVTVVPEDTGPAREETVSRASNAIDKVRLLGVFRGDASGVLVSYEDEQRRMAIGDTIEDWELTMTSTEGAVFQSGDEERIISLEHALPGVNQRKGAAGSDGMNRREAERRRLLEQRRQQANDGR